MTTTSDRPHQEYWRARFLLNVHVETAPAELVHDALEELRALLVPIAASNRAFLNGVTDILHATKDTDLRARGAEPVRLGLVFDDLEKQLDRSISLIRPGDEESLYAAARVAQVWGWIAMKLRDELGDLARFVSRSNAPARMRAVQEHIRISGAG